MAASLLSTCNPDLSIGNIGSPATEQAVLNMTVGCKTYMGVLSLQGWRRKVAVLIFQRATHCGTFATHPVAHTRDNSRQEVKQARTRRGVSLLCTIKQSHQKVRSLKCYWEVSD